MSKVFLPAAIAGIVAAAVSYGTAKWSKPPQQLVTIAAPQIGWASLDASPAKARRIAQTTWPEMEQAEIDAMVAVLKKKPERRSFTVFCIDDAKCADLALNLENVFESSHWQVEVRNAPMLPNGIVVSSTEMADLFNGATHDRFGAVVDGQKNAPGEYIAIGHRVQGPK